MATLEEKKLLFKIVQKSYNEYANLNLSHNYQPPSLYTVSSIGDSSNNVYKTSNIDYKNYSHMSGYNNAGSDLFSKSKINHSSNFCHSNYTWNDAKIDLQSSSTLDIHITAFKNSQKELNACKEATNFDTKWKRAITIPSILAHNSLCPFGFPRQMDKHNIQTFDVVNFKISQRLFDVYGGDHYVVSNATKKNMEFCKWLIENNAYVLNYGQLFPAFEFNEYYFVEQNVNYLNQFRHPTIFQSLCWPAIFESRNLIAIAPENSGKLTTFAVAAVECAVQFGKPNSGCGILIISYIRKRINEIEAKIKEISGDTITTMALHGQMGTKRKQELKQQFQNGIHILITNIGSLMVLYADGQQFLPSLLIIDEAEILQKADDTAKYIFREMLTDRCQRLLFTRTLPHDIQNIFIFESFPTFVQCQTADVCVEDVANGKFIDYAKCDFEETTTLYLPQIYRELLIEAKKNNFKLNEDILYNGKYVQIVQNLLVIPKTPLQLGEKLKTFNYLMHIEELLSSYIPLATDAKICEKEESFQQMKAELEETKKNVVKDVDIGECHSVMYLKASMTDKDAEEIHPLKQLYLIKNCDLLKDVVRGVNKLKVKCLLLLKKAETCYMLISMKETVREIIENSEDTVFSVFSLPNDTLNKSIVKSIDTLISADSPIISKLEPTLNQDYGTFRIIDPNYDSSQNQGICGILMPRLPKFPFVIEGPAGTGKSQVIAKALSLLIPNPNHRILIMTHTNSAADVITAALLKMLQDSPLRERIFRFMAASRDPYNEKEELASVTTKIKLLDEHYAMIRPVYGKKWKNELSKYGVIVCTLAFAPQLKQCIKIDNFFSHLILDEAAQAPLMEVWNAAQLLAHSDTKLIFAGDKQQLGPTTKSDILQRSEYGFKESIMHRLTRNEYLVQNFYLYTLLDVNYRCDPTITKLLSQLFYDDVIHSPLTPHHNAFLELDFLPSKKCAVIFFDVKFGKEYSADTTSFANLEEAEIVGAWIKKFKDFGISSDQIGVVSPYSLQTKVVKEKINDDEIIVGTVEKLQGDERNIILITTARTEKHGFLCEKERINTSISRAKKLVIIVGKKNLLQTDECWNGVIEYCKINETLMDQFK